MPTTIDSLQIQIESSSANAGKSIRELGGALEELKKNGSFTTAINNLNKLRDSLRLYNNVPSNASKILSLSKSLESLKTVGSVTSIGNSLSKLAGSLKTLNGVDVDKGKMDSIADALSTLSAVKAGGINTMMNGLMKLGKVTKSLDDEAINAFAERIEILTEKLTPLSQKMTTIQAGLKGINSSARSAAKGIKDMGDDLDTASVNLSSFIYTLQEAVQWLQAAIQKFSEFMSAAIEWDGISARFGRTFGDQAEDVYGWIQQLNKEMGINVQQFMQYSSLYAQMLTGFGVATEDARNMAVGYTELTYDIWASANDRYKTFEEAADAVASAIAGEVEPIRRAGFTIVESTLAETAAYHGLDISLANATEAQKSYLRYLTLVDQAHSTGTIGVYAKELNTAEGMMRTFSQQLKSLTQAFGSLFLPILVKVMPYFQAFVEILKDGVYWLANLLGVEIQKVNFSGFESGAGAIDGVGESANNATGALNDATQAAKELKNATLGIDELNVISPPSASSSAGAGAGGAGAGSSGFEGMDIDSLWDKTIFDDIQNDVDAIKKKLKGWLPVVAGVATALAGLKLTNLLDDIEVAGFKLGNLGKVISVAGISIAVGKLVWDFTGAYLEGGDEVDLLKALGTTVLGTALAGWLAGKPGAAFTLLVSGVVTLTKLGVEISEGTVEWNDTESIVTGLIGGIETAIGALFTWKTFSPMIKKAWPKIVAAAKPALAVAAPYLGIAAAVVGGIVLAFVDYDFTEVGRKVGEKVGEALRTAGDWAANVGESIWEGIKTGFNWLKDALDIDDVWDVVAVLFVPGEWLKRISPEITELFTGIEDWINEKIENLKGNINEFFDGFFEGLFDGLDIDVSWAEKFTDFFDIEYLDIVETIVNPGSIGKKIFDGITDSIAETDFFQTVKDFFDIDYSDIVETIVNPDSIGTNIVEGVVAGISNIDMFENVKETFNGFVDKVKGFFGINSPSTLMRDEIGVNLIDGIISGMGVDGIRDALSTLWNNAKEWWDTKGNLKAYTPSIGSIKDKVSSAWTSAKTWWDTKKSGLKSYTPSIGSIYEKVKDRWDNAREWWNNKKSAMKTYTPSIGSIYEKVYDRWKNARDWWNSKKGSFKTYTPSIGSIVDKIKSAWNTAKNWWSKNAKLSTKLDVKVPKIEVKWDTATAFGKSFKYPTGFKLKFAAAGGVFDQGSLVWAGERGPEVLANAGGGRTGVMNIQQMQDAVYEGVYSAVVAAMSATRGEGGSQAVNVYLDGRQITNAVEQRQRERGASLMGREVYA